MVNTELWVWLLTLVIPTFQRHETETGRRIAFRSSLGFRVKYHLKKTTPNKKKMNKQKALS